MIAACEGDAAFTASTPAESATSTPPATSETTSAADTTQAPPGTDTTAPPPTTETTGTTAPPPGFPFDVHPVDAVELCVIGLGWGGTFNVREGPSTDFDVVGTLPYGRTVPSRARVAPVGRVDSPQSRREHRGFTAPKEKKGSHSSPLRFIQLGAALYY